MNNLSPESDCYNIHPQMDAPSLLQESSLCPPWLGGGESGECQGGDSVWEWRVPGPTSASTV